MNSRSSGIEALGWIDSQVRKEFDSNRRILTFDEYIQIVGESPERALRGSAQYVIDTLDHFGRDGERFRLFDVAHEPRGRRVVDHQAVQKHLYNALKGFVRQGVNNKLILLHGPNGSAKSSIVHALMSGMEKYSEEAEGALYTFNWVFPVDKVTKGSMGLSSSYSGSTGREAGTSFAKLPDEEILARIPCETRDHPLLLIPMALRQTLLKQLLGQERADALWSRLPLNLTHGNLPHRDRLIFDALLTAHGGDLKKVLMHVQVERFYFSRRYRRGLSTVEPQLHVDAQWQQLTMNRSIGSIPPVLQGLNLFSLSGDLIDGNRGMLEFSDLLKRPLDSFKYLLIACENNQVTVGHSILHMDTVFIGTTNELQLDSFKEFPDFNSFKARIELVRVPYLLQVSKEAEIYSNDIEQIRLEKPVAPHVAWALAYWAVLTRVKRPNGINYPPSISALVSALTPVEKARLYDTGELPARLNPEERKALRGALKQLQDEYVNIPYYEGRMGASAREMRSLLFSSAMNPQFRTVTPLSIFRELEEFVKRVSEYEFLKQDVKDGYHDASEFITTVREEWLNRVDREVRDCLGLYDSSQWEDFLRKYVGQISLVLKKEKRKNSITGQMEDPDFTLISEFEKIVDAPTDPAPKEAFRQNLLSQVGAWSLDHPNEAVVYAKVFPEYWDKLEKHYYESQKSLLTKMHNALMLHGTADEGSNAHEEGARLARQTVENMCKKMGYPEEAAREVIAYLMKARY